MYGTPTNPLPYIQASYILGFIFIFGYTFWLLFARKKTQKFLNALNKEIQK